MEIRRSTQTGLCLLVVEDNLAVILEGSFKGKLLTEFDTTDVSVYGIECHIDDNELFEGVVLSAYSDNKYLDVSDICITDIIARHKERGQATSIEWVDTKEVKCPNTHQWRSIIVFKESDNTVWFNYAGVAPAPCPAAPSDIHSMSLMYISKSSQSYRNIKKADVKLSADHQTIVSGEGVPATIIVEL